MPPGVFVRGNESQMYLNHYGLTKKPFDLSLRPGFLWLGEEHAEALATLNYGIQEDMGFLLLTGDVGVGKTVLIRRLIANLTSSTAVAHITDPDLAPMDFFKIVASEFGIDAQFSKKADFLIAFKTFLQQAHKEQKKVLLIIDEAQRLNNDMLDQIRVFSNIERGDRKLINIFFVGQPEFKDMLLTDRNRALRQRIAVNYHINPLTEAEVGQYIQHRLKRAGSTKEIFEDDAFHEIFAFTGGFPRAINIICDHALMTGYSYGLNSINEGVIKECTNELRIREERKPVEALSQTPVAVRLPETMAPPPEKKPLFSPRTYPLLIGICALLSVILIILLMRPDSSETTQIVSTDESRDVSSMNSGQPVDDDRLHSFSKDPVPPLANDEWRQEEKMKIERALTTQKETGGPVRPEAGTQHEANNSAVGDEDISGKSDPLLAMRPLPSPPETEIRTSPRVLDERTTGVGQPSSDNSVDTSAAKKEAVASSPTHTSASLANEKGKSEEPVVIPQKSLEAMAVMSAALATKEEATGKSVTKTSPLVGNRPAVSSSSTSGTSSKATSTKKLQPEPSQSKKSDTAVVTAPTSKPAKKTATKSTTNTAGSIVAGGVAASTVVSKAQPKTVAIAPSTRTTRTTATTVNRAAPSPASPKETSASPTSPTTTGSRTSVQTAGNTGGSDDKPNLVAGLDNRLRWFLKSYCITYARKDLDAFTKFFVPGALENGKSFASLIPKYKRNFELIETIQYRIDMQNFIYDEASGTITVDGNFSLQWLPPDRKWRENSGTISMVLIEKDTSFMVQRLDYHGNG